MIYTVTFNPAIDYVVQLNGTLNPGRINRSVQEDYQFGGKGINVSNVLKTLGHDSITLGFVAGFTGEGLEKGLNAMGLETRFIHAEQGMTRINVKIRGEEETEINGTGPRITDAHMEMLYAQLDAIRQGDTLVLSGSIPNCLPADTYEKILARLSGRGIRILVDAAGELLLKALKYRPFLIKPNVRELGELFSAELKTDMQILSCARRLRELGAENVLVSLAGDGALLLDEKGISHRIRCPEGRVANSVGSGDSMVAGFLAGWLETGDYDAALKLATAAGSATAFCLGLADKDSITRLLAEL